MQNAEYGFNTVHALNQNALLLESCRVHNFNLHAVEKSMRFEKKCRTQLCTLRAFYKSTCSSSTIDYASAICICPRTVNVYMGNVDCS